MTAIRNCLNKLADAGRITRRAADDALAIHEGIQGRLVGHMPPQSADAAAALEAARLMASEAKRRKLSIAKTAIGRERVLERVKSHPKGVNAGAMALFSRDPVRAQSGGVDAHTEVIEKWLFSKAHAFIDAYRSKFPGFGADYAGTRNMVREAFGTRTGDQSAEEAWGAWSSAITAGVDRMKQAGIMITELDDWKLPQFWSTNRVRRAPEREFTDDLFDSWRSGGLQIIDKATGAPAADLRVPAILKQAYDDINRGMTIRHDKMRVFRFQDADAWWKFMDKYGPSEKGVYGMLVNHLNAMSRDIALAEKIAPDHNAVMRDVIDLAKQDWATKSTAQKRSFLTRLESPDWVERAYKVASGQTGAVESELFAGIFGALRNIATGRLGSSVTIAIPGDTFTAVAAARHNGMAPMRVVSGFLKSIAQRPKNFRALAARLDITANTAMDFGTQSGRFEEAITGRGLTARFADMVVRGSGLRAWTERMKTVFSMEMMGHLAENFGNNWKGLNAPTRQFLRRNGVTPGEWDTIRASQPLEVRGAMFMDPSAMDGKLSDKLLGGIIDERFAAVIEPDSRVRAATTLGTKRGNFLGELWRSSLQFLSFPMMFTMTHIYRAAALGPWWTRPARMASLVGMMTIAGAISSQMRNILSGKDPEDMSRPDFWKRAAFQGGGLSIYGDFIFSAVNRRGNDPVVALGGPPAQLLDDSLKLALNIGSGDAKERGKFGKRLVKFMENWTPGSTLWYARLAADRYIFDFLESLADPDYYRSFARQQQRLRQDRGQEFFFAPGTTSPQRPPDFGAAVP